MEPAFDKSLEKICEDCFLTVKKEKQLLLT